MHVFCVRLSVLCESGSEIICSFEINTSEASRIDGLHSTLYAPFKRVCGLSALGGVDRKTRIKLVEKRRSTHRKSNDWRILRAGGLAT